MKISGAGPEGIAFTSVAMDDKKPELYVLAGWPSTIPSAELYRIDLSAHPPAWQNLDPSGARPAGRNGAGMIFDAARQRLVIFGGDGDSGTNFSPLGDCWQYDIVQSKWSELPAKGTPPPARWHACMAVSQASQKAYLFGGAGRKVEFDACLYELDLSTDTWRQLDTTGSGPPSLQGASMTFDESHHVVVLAGGLRHVGKGPATLSQVWIFDPETHGWDVTDCGDYMRRRDHVAAYNPRTGEHLLLSGRVSQTIGDFYGKGTFPSTDIRLIVKPTDQNGATSKP